MRVQASSAIYYIFVASVFFLYWTSARSRLLRLAIILLANYSFCAQFSLFYVVLIPACSTVDYLAGLVLMRSKHPAIRRLMLAISVTLNLTLLIAARYTAAWGWVFPLSLSFYVFQAL